jgi:hypothetical protein
LGGFLLISGSFFDPSRSYENRSVYKIFTVKFFSELCFEFEKKNNKALLSKKNMKNWGGGALGFWAKGVTWGCQKI